MEIVMIFILFIFVAILIRVIAGGFDEDRVGNYLRNQGGELISKTWEPFGKGWFGEQNDRIYKVIYKDKDGNTHEAFTKTSSFSGVYFTDDRIIEYANKEPEVNKKGESSLIEELEALKKENARLKRLLGE